MLVATRNLLSKKITTLQDQITKATEDDVGQGMLLLDGVFSHVHRSHPDEAHYVETQDRIDAAMAHMRDMGLSITPKMHGMEKHVVNQMRATRGGIGRLVVIKLGTDMMWRTIGLVHK